MFLLSIPLILALLLSSEDLRAQSTTSKPAAKTPPAKIGTGKSKPSIQYPQVHILGLRPGITFDSANAVIKAVDGKWREVRIDTLTRNFGDPSIRIMVLDSIYVRFG